MVVVPSTVTRFGRGGDVDGSHDENYVSAMGQVWGGVKQTLFPAASTRLATIESMAWTVMSYTVNPGTT